MFSFYNPVRSVFGAGSLARLPELLGGRSCYIITSAGVVARGLVDSVRTLAGAEAIEGVYAGTTPNPAIGEVTRAAAEIGPFTSPLVLAIGGGSVLDTAKAIAAQRAPNCGGDWLSRHLREGAPFPEPFRPAGIVAVPTTAGTGSEVTMWATMWDEVGRRKFSLSHPALYPEAALIDPELTVTAPRELTAATALDALSHAMEAIWNRHANPVSDALASQAIAAIPAALLHCLQHPRDHAARRDLHSASWMAGLAFSNTRTAIAHSISYPLTAELGVPHGFACSLTLPRVLQWNGSRRPERVMPILRALGSISLAGAVEKLDDLFAQAGLADYLRPYFPSPAVIDGIQGTFTTPGRAENNIVPTDQEMAKQLLSASLRKLNLA